MFRYFKAKRAEAEFKAAIWGKVYDAVNNFPDLIEMAKKARNMDIPEVQKMIVEELVSYMKTKETNKAVTKADTKGK